MRIHHRVLYLPTSADVPKAERTQNWWRAWNISIAVKDGTLKGYFVVKAKDGKQVRIDKNNAILARQIFGTWVVHTAKKVAKDFVLVPIPSKDAVIGTNKVPRSAQLVRDALSALKPTAPVADIVRFTEELEKASKGGPRFADQIYPKLALTSAPPKKALILVDDIMTSGGHMKAVRKLLADAGGNVACGIVCGRTVYSANLDPLAEGSIDIDDSLTHRDFDVANIISQLLKE